MIILYEHNNILNISEHNQIKLRNVIKEKEEPNFKVYNIQISEEENHVYEIHEEEEEEYETIHDENNKIMEENTKKY